MKYFHLTLAVALGFSLTACATSLSQQNVDDASKVAANGTSTSSAQTTQNQRGSSRGGGHGKQNFFDSYDANKNQSVTVEEYMAERVKGYTARDLNKDGNVRSDEYVSEYEARLEQDLAEMRDRQLKQAYVRFDVLDNDKNGVISLEEFQASGMRMFTRLDTNKDNVVDAADTAERY